MGTLGEKSLKLLLGFPEGARRRKRGRLLWAKAESTALMAEMMPLARRADPRMQRQNTTAGAARAKTHSKQQENRKRRTLFWRLLSSDERRKVRRSQEDLVFLSSSRFFSFLVRSPEKLKTKKEKHRKKGRKKGSKYLKDVGFLSLI